VRPARVLLALFEERGFEPVVVGERGFARHAAVFVALDRHEAVEDALDRHGGVDAAGHHVVEVGVDTVSSRCTSGFSEQKVHAAFGPSRNGSAKSASGKSA